MTPNGSYCELPKRLREWEDLYYGGGGPLEHAQRNPDRWHEAFLLGVTEVAALALGIRMHPRETAWAVRYDNSSDRYLAYPLRLMPRRLGLIVKPHPWHHLYGPMMRAAFRPFRAAMLRVGDAVAVASDVLSQLVEGLCQIVRVSRRVA